MGFSEFKIKVDEIDSLENNKSKIDSKKEIELLSEELKKVSLEGLKKYSNKEEELKYFNKLSNEVREIQAINNSQKKNILENTQLQLKDIITSIESTEVYNFFDFTGIEKVMMNSNIELFNDFGMDVYKNYLNFIKEFKNRKIELKLEQLEHLKKSIKLKNLSIIKYVRKRKKELFELREDLKIELSELQEEKKYILKNKKAGITVINPKIRKKQKEIKNLTGKSYIWIINGEIQKEYNSYNESLILNADILSKKYKGKLQISQRQNSLYNSGEKLKNVENMFNSKVDKKGNFEGGGIFGWEIFDSTNEDDKKFLKEEKIEDIDGINLLSEENEIIELKHTIGTIIAIIPMIIPFLGGALSAGADIYDLTHINQNAITEAIKSVNIVPEHFRVNKEKYEMAIAGISIGLSIFGLQGLVKGTKLGQKFLKLQKSLKRVSKEKLDLIILDISKKMNFPEEKIINIIDKIQNNIGKGVDILKYTEKTRKLVEVFGEKLNKPSLGKILGMFMNPLNSPRNLLIGISEKNIIDFFKESSDFIILNVINIDFSKLQKGKHYILTGIKNLTDFDKTTASRILSAQAKHLLTNFTLVAENGTNFQLEQTQKINSNTFNVINGNVI